MRSSRGEITLDGEQRDNTRGKLVADRLNVTMRRGRELAETSIAKVSGQIIEHDGRVAVPHNPAKDDTVGDIIQRYTNLGSQVSQRMGMTTDQVVGQVRSERSAEQANESRERERASARERSARLYAAKKARLAQEPGGVEI